MGLEIQKLRKELKNGRKNKDVAKGNAWGTWKQRCRYIY
jgi:hypothetical protein